MDFKCKGYNKMKRHHYYFVVLLSVLTICWSAAAQELVVLPGGVLEKNDKAEVSGDYVRVRTGPTLEYRILTKVNRGTPVTILERGEELVSIKDMKNYWYKIRLDKSGIEGWMYGHFLHKKEEPEPETQASIPTIEDPIPFKTEEVKPVEKAALIEPTLPLLDNVGSIQEARSLITSGDVNNNDVPEIIFLSRDERNRSLYLIGYEADTNRGSKAQYVEVYRIDMRGADIHGIEVFSGEWLGTPLIVANGKTFSQIFTYDESRKTLKHLYKTDSPLISMGSLDGTQTHIVYMKKHRTPDNDGTVTYDIHAASFILDRGRFSLQDRISYTHPLPVKKMVTYDLDGDSRAEIVCEIGGQEKGGGIVVLGLGETGLKRTLNSGIVTYKDNQFVRMWGTTVQDDPRLVLYTTDPENGNDAGTSFGFLLAKLKGRDLLVDRFYPVNKLLDDANNYREPLIVDDDSELPFLVMDYDENKNRYELKRPVY
jgi:hypothetical protein